MEPFQVNLKQLIFATIMGAIAFTVRNAGIYIVVLDPFKLDPRWVFSLLAACWTGPLGGLISGTLAAMKLPYPLIDLACIPVHFLIGLVARFLKSKSQPCIVACVLWPILGVPAYLVMSTLFLQVNIQVLTLTLAFIGFSTSILALIVGYTIEKRAKFLLYKLLE